MIIDILWLLFFYSVEIAMLFPNVDFSKLELRQRRKLKEELFHQLRSLLSNGFSLTDIHDVWFDQVLNGEGTVYTESSVKLFAIIACLYDHDYDILSKYLLKLSLIFIYQ